MHNPANYEDNPRADDKFTRGQILAYLEEIPLEYVTEAEHAFAESLIKRIQRHFVRLSTAYVPSGD
jgi:hypothetical protein